MFLYKTHLVYEMKRSKKFVFSKNAWSVYIQLYVKKSLWFIFYYETQSNYQNLGTICVLISGYAS